MRTTIRLAAPALAVAVAFAAGGLGASASPRRGWRIVATIGSATRSALPGMLAATGAADAFSSWQCAGCSVATRNRNFVKHWNGRAWRKIALPPRLNYPSFLITLGASSASNLWVLTTTRRAGIWNGKRWVIRPLPRWVLTTTREGDPAGTIVVFRHGDTWIFSQPTLAAHWYKGAWHKVRLPAVADGVAPVTRNDIWTMGATRKSLSTAHPVWTAMHWNGSAWRTLALPAVRMPAGSSVFYTITATGARSVWASRLIDRDGKALSNVLLHWTGRWHAVTAPPGTVSLGAMASDGSGGLWMLAVRHGRRRAVSVLYHYGRGGWTRRAIPTMRGLTNFITSLTWVPGTRSLLATGMLSAHAGAVEFGDILKYSP